ncbi:putative phosphoenolpyruvate carboxykinase [Besnoitia besnoiti]|uniref:phosphoenolpyruvate carboxykinase (ATP) n=1 Tax=Besnoitia besnoiti TaxID=94643 RepID=A0A2A9M261_BESBE|nr:putative phosphoenolpyruvate carboxykinase [Besnoitia besnoiti]PFH32075.1 putative phosphoenolpyruvate carboxykinase [Besnoitia besnoiti]
MAEPVAPETHKEDYQRALRRKLEGHLAHHAHKAPPLTKKEVLDLGQLQHEVHVEDECRAQGLTTEQIFYNAAVPLLYEQALQHESSTLISNTGVLCCSSGLKTRRSPEDKRIVREGESQDRVWWGKVNIPFEEQSYLFNRERAIDFLNTQKRLFVVDGFAGADPEYCIKVRLIATRAYHALFMRNILLRPTLTELQAFEPDFTIYNAGLFPANRFAEGVSSQTSVALHLGRGEMVILGTQYAGELHKGIFTYVNYVMPPKNVLPLHASCIVGSARSNSDVTMLLGLTATGKTALVATAEGEILADDEVMWTPKGVAGVLGGCYVRCKDIQKDPCQAFTKAMTYGSVMENVVLDEETRQVYFYDTSITDNTRCTYPLTYLEHGSKGRPAVPMHPKHFVMLLVDLFALRSVLSIQLWGVAGMPLRKQYGSHGTIDFRRDEMRCFLQHSSRGVLVLCYAGGKETQRAWYNGLVDEHWLGGGPAYGVAPRSTGSKVPLDVSRRILKAVHDGTMNQCSFQELPVLNLEIPVTLDGVPEDLLSPLRAWVKRTGDPSKFMEQAQCVASLFAENFKQFEGLVSCEVASVLRGNSNANGAH